MDDNLIWSAYVKAVETVKSPVCKTKIASCGFDHPDDIPTVKNKCYIAFGEMCFICMDPIVSKNNAWLTPCGHAFHRKCLITNHQYRQKHNMTLEFSNEIPCPVCREGLVNCCVGLDDMDKYTPENGLDRLENFWSSFDVVSYLSCWRCEKGFGMNILCKPCEKYRNTGEI